MVKIDIISGFLGAGKTTLIKKLLKDGFQGEQVVLIENEFGEIGIDGGFLKEAGIQIREMNSGCICCSLVGDFGTSLKEVVTKYNPDRILIEPSGVGKLSDVIKAVQGVQDEVDIKLNSYTTVVDAKKCKMYMKNFGEFFDNQIQYAGAIIMSRTDIATEKKVQESLELLRSLNKDAAIITTPIENLDGKKLVEVMEHPVSLEQEMLEEEHEHHHHHHDDECGCGHDHDHEEHEHHHHDHDEEGGFGHDHDHEEKKGFCPCGHDAVSDGVGHDRAMGRIFFALLGGLLTVNSFLLEWLLPGQQYAASMSALFGAFILALPIIITAIKDLINGKVYMNELVALAILAALASGDFQTAGIIAFFLLLTIIIYELLVHVRQTRVSQTI